MLMHIRKIKKSHLHIKNALYFIKSRDFPKLELERVFLYKKEATQRGRK